MVVTDVWTSMGQEEERKAREAAFAGYCVDEKLMAQAKPDAMVQHCLPAHRGRESPRRCSRPTQSTFSRRRRTAFTPRRPCW